MRSNRKRRILIPAFAALALLAAAGGAAWNAHQTAERRDARQAAERQEARQAALLEELRASAAAAVEINRLRQDAARTRVEEDRAAGVREKLRAIEEASGPLSPDHREYLRDRIVEQHFGRMFAAEILDVVDGDTVAIMYDGERTLVRLLHIDAPEPGQPGAAEATAELEHILAQNDMWATVRLEADTKRDGFGRLLAVLQLREPTELGAMTAHGHLLQGGWVERYDD